jgi:hypothetical protein
MWSSLQATGGFNPLRAEADSSPPGRGRRQGDSQAKACATILPNPTPQNVETPGPGCKAGDTGAKALDSSRYRRHD